MTMVLLGSLTGTLLGWLMGFLSVFLIMLILIQRGKGGGLTGALGGPGGQSAFGSKAGDTFTVITIVVASLWAFTCALTMLLLGTGSMPSVVAEDTNVSAGPGDDEELPSSMPNPSSEGFSGGIGGTQFDQSPATTQTPSMELTPAESVGDRTGAASESAESPSESQPAVDPASDATPDDSTAPADTPQATDTPEVTDEPVTDEPAPDPSENPSSEN